MKLEADVAIEFLLVRFPEQRAVLADDDSVGFTNHLMLLPPDSYRIALDGDGFEPAFQDVQISGTSAVRPFVVVFAATPARKKTHGGQA